MVKAIATEDWTKQVAAFSARRVAHVESRIGPLAPDRRKVVYDYFYEMGISRKNPAETPPEVSAYFETDKDL